VIHIQTRQELVDLARELGVRAAWHEPDEQGLEARVKGVTFDNAGFWGRAYLPRHREAATELYVTLLHEGQPVAEVNLATLFSFACGFEGDR
jgi:hypothetical protein